MSDADGALRTSTTDPARRSSRIRRWNGVFTSLLLTSFAVAGSLVLSSPTARADQLSDLQAQASQLQSQITDTGARIDALSQQYDAAQLQLQTVTQNIQVTQTRIAADAQRLSRDEAALRKSSLNAYVTDNTAASANPLFTTNQKTVSAESEYVQVADGDLEVREAQVRSDQDRLGAQKELLRHQQQQVQATLDDAAQARSEAQAQQSQLQTMENQDQGQIHTLIVQQQQAQQAAEQRAALAQLAAARAAADAKAQAQSSSAPVQSPPASSAASEATQTPSSAPAAAPQATITPTTSAPTETTSAPTETTSPPAQSPADVPSSTDTGATLPPTSPASSSEPSTPVTEPVTTPVTEPVSTSAPAPDTSGSDGSSSGGAPVSSPSAPPSSGGGAAAVAAAESQIGVPYVYAGETPGVGFDCSGLTAWAWSQAGVSLDHYSGAQMQESTPVPLSDLQPGDLLFYGPGGADHVTMYVGGGEMIEAPHPGASVWLVPLNTSDDGGAFAGAGRP